LNYYQAQELLTAVKHGRPTSIRDINMALYLTGDYCGPLCEDGFEPCDYRSCEVSSEGVGEPRTWMLGGFGEDGGLKAQGVER